MKTLPTDQKLRGGYYTPPLIARFLADWGVRRADDQILEPSAGDGNVLLAAAEAVRDRAYETGALLPVGTVHGIEIEETEACKAADRVLEANLQTLVDVQCGDFFVHSTRWLREGRHFDAIVGNPPFIRYQNWPDDLRSFAFRIMEDAGLHPSKLTNAWVPFIVASTMLLNQQGRLAMVIPAELLQVSYAAELRQFLSDQYSKITLVTFRKLVFEGIQQEVVLVLGERNGDECTGIRTLEMDSLDDLAAHKHTAFGEELKPLDHGREKWTRYFLTGSELDLLRRIERHPALTLSGQIIVVDVGVVTGLNAFFVLTNEQVEAHGLQEHTTPIVSRSAHLGGLVFGRDEWQQNALNSLPAHLLLLPDMSRDQLPSKVLAYVESGEKQGINTGYKCRIRKNWWTVPSVWIPDAFMLRQIHGYPKLIVNEAGATSTDTIHRVRLRNGTTARTVATAMLNSLTFAFAEVVGRSYGGGVLELEPTEAEKLPMPMRGAERLDLAELDRLLMAGSIEQALDITDRVLLVEGLGLTIGEAAAFRGIWKKLRDRRAGRK